MSCADKGIARNSLNMVAMDTPELEIGCEVDAWSVACTCFTASITKAKEAGDIWSRKVSSIEMIIGADRVVDATETSRCGESVFVECRRLTVMH